jgi:hypothetical protein
MKLDVNVLRYLSKEDWRVLTSVEMGQKNVSLWVGGCATAGGRGGRRRLWQACARASVCCCRCCAAAAAASVPVCENGGEGEAGAGTCTHTAPAVSPRVVGGAWQHCTLVHARARTHTHTHASRCVPVLRAAPVTCSWSAARAGAGAAGG